MERKVKVEIIKMLIPLLGTWWVINRILPDLDDPTWWDVSPYSIPIRIGLVIYQIICWIGYKMVVL